MPQEVGCDPSGHDREQVYGIESLREGIDLEYSTRMVGDIFEELRVEVIFAHPVAHAPKAPWADNDAVSLMLVTLSVKCPWLWNQMHGEIGQNFRRARAQALSLASSC